MLVHQMMKQRMKIIGTKLWTSLLNGAENLSSKYLYIMIFCTYSLPSITTLSDYLISSMAHFAHRKIDLVKRPYVKSAENATVPSANIVS